MCIINNRHFIKTYTVSFHTIFLYLPVLLLRNILVRGFARYSLLILYSIASIRVKVLFLFWRIQNIHDLVVSDALLLQIFSLIKRLCSDLLLSFQVALCLGKVLVPM